MSFVKIKSALTALLLVMLVACGGGGGSAGTAVLGSGAGTPVLGGGTGAGTTPTVNVGLAVRLLDANGAATTAIVAGQPVRAQAILTKNGVAVDGEIVQFAVDTANLVKIDPVSGSKLTETVNNVSGLAEVTVSSLGAGAGAGRITATAKVGEVTATGAANFFASGTVGSQPATLTLGPVEIGKVTQPAIASVSAYGTTSVEVTVLQGAQLYLSPVTVNFTSSCAAGKYSLTASAVTQSSGRAVATFVDNGCAQTADSEVTITASIGTDTKSAKMIVKAPTAGSLRFVSATPSDKSITLRGQGGNGRQENAIATFKLVDVAGNGVADVDVCFDVTTYVGGLNLDGFTLGKLPTPQGSITLCGSDLLSVVRYVKRTNADGTVSVQINAGTVPTPVRVRARALYPATANVPLETFSDTLSISTGLPLQRSFSLSVDQANIDGGNFDGVIAKLTVRLTDQFSNPVPDGTAVNFIASGGAVCTANKGSCLTVDGVCSCDFVSQARRPLDNRVVVTAYAVGLEDYDDNNGDNVYTPPDSTYVGDLFYDLPDAYVDANKDGRPSTETINGETDILLPYQQGKAYSAVGDGVRGTAHIRASTIIYLSQASTLGDPTVVMARTQFSQERNLLTGNLSPLFLRLTPSCPQGTPLPQGSISMVLEDGLGNPMSAGTSLAPVDNTDNLAPNAFRPSSVLAIGARPPSPIDLHNLPKLKRVAAPGASPAYVLNAANGTVSTQHSVAVRGVADKCSGDGSFGLEVASPRGGKALARLLYDGESRDVGRSSFDVRYRSTGLTFAISLFAATKTVTISSAALLQMADEGAVTQTTVDWGDGTFPVPTGVATLAASSHVYAAARTYTIRVTATTLNGPPASSTQTVTIP